MDAVLKKHLKDTSDDEVEQLVLDNENVGNTLAFLKRFPNVSYLSLNACRISSLEQLPNLPLLSRLELADNKLSATSHLNELSKLTAIARLDLSNTRIESAEELSVLKPLSNLSVLDLMGSPLAEKDSGYRKKVFEVLRQVKVIDNFDRYGPFLDKMFTYIYAQGWE